MSAFIYGTILQWKLDLRDRGVLLAYYIVPLVFFAFMAGIFSSIDPNARNTLIQNMTIFGITMGSLMGTPSFLTNFYGSEIKKAYRVGNIPLWTVAVNNAISAFLHLFLMSLVIFIAAPIAFDAKIPDNLPLYFGTLAIFILASVSIGTLLGLIVKNSSKLTMFSMFLFLPSTMISGIMFPSSMLPKVLQMLSKIFPATWGAINLTAAEFEPLSMLPLVGIILVSLVICGWRIHYISVES